MAKNVNERIKDTMAAVFNMPVKKIFKCKFPR